MVKYSWQAEKTFSFDKFIKKTHQCWKKILCLSNSVTKCQGGVNCTAERQPKESQGDFVTGDVPGSPAAVSSPMSKSCLKA